MSQPSQPVSFAVHIEENSIEQAPQGYFDGAAGISIGPVISKVHFHQVVGTDRENKIEKRKVVFTAIIPTVTLVEFCVNVMSGIGQNAAGLREQIAVQTENMLKGFPPTPPG